MDRWGPRARHRRAAPQTRQQERFPARGDVHEASCAAPQPARSLGALPLAEDALHTIRAAFATGGGDARG